MSVLLLILTAVIAYVLGSVNGAIIISRYVYRKDIRKHGSGNAGLNNMIRVFGVTGGALVLLIDVVKSILAVLIGGWLLRIVDAGETGQLFAGFCLIMGHVFPMYYHFKGGKGALCGIVLMFIVDWRAGFCCLAVFLIIVVLTRYMSLGSMVGAILSPVFLIAFGHTGLNCLTALLCGLLIIVEHAENILRLIGGTESKFSIGGKPSRSRKNEDEEDFY